MKTLFFVLAFAFGTATIVSADTQTVGVAASAVRAVTTAEGTHYVVEISLPQGITSVRHVWLEMRLDASSQVAEGVVDPAPMLEVYVLKGSLSGDPGPSDFDETRLPMSRPVALGTNRLARIDITEFAQRILANPTKNHGIVLGALTGARSGEFTVNPDAFGPGTPARITIIR